MGVPSIPASLPELSARFERLGANDPEGRARSQIPMRDRASTRSASFIRAPRSAVYRTLLDGQALPKWKVPHGMTCRVHAFEAHEGGAFRVSLTYEQGAGTGKTTAHTDTYHGHFVKLVPDERVVETVEFETADPAMQGEMTITWQLTETGGGTQVVAVHENLPPGLAAADNELGWKMALDQLTQLVERASR